MGSDPAVPAITSLMCAGMFQLGTIDRVAGTQQFRQQEQKIVSTVADEQGLTMVLLEAQGLANLFSTSFPLKIDVVSFFSGSKRHSISPALQFSCNFDEAAMVYEMRGEAPYDDIIVYGENIREAWDILEKEILPIMWEDFVSAENAKLSSKAQKIKFDLERRVEA